MNIIEIISKSPATVTKRQFRDLSHTYFSMGKIVTALLNQDRFYKVELAFLRDNGGEPSEISRVERLIITTEADLRKAKAELAEVKSVRDKIHPFIHAKDWYRDWER